MQLKCNVLHHYSYSQNLRSRISENLQWVTWLGRRGTMHVFLCRISTLWTLDQASAVIFGSSMTWAVWLQNHICNISRHAASKAQQTEGKMCLPTFAEHGDNVEIGRILGEQLRRLRYHLYCCNILYISFLFYLYIYLSIYLFHTSSESLTHSMIFNMIKCWHPRI